MDSELGGQRHGSRHLLQRMDEQASLTGHLGGRFGLPRPVAARCRSLNHRFPVGWGQPGAGNRSPVSCLSARIRQPTFQTSK